MDLDLNQEPLDQPQDSVLGLDSILNELEIAHGRIEERIRQLEAVTTRASQRQRWRQGQIPVQSVETTVERPITDAHSGGGLNIGNDGVAAQRRASQAGKTSKKSGSYLVAQALGIEPEPTTFVSKTGGFFDCNVCLKVARDPILTCCGHLFCWSCFYQLSYVHSNSKECPVCQGEVADTNIIPIYGNGNDNHPHNLKLKESSLKVPPRPHAQRIESIRQRIISRGASSPLIEERIQQISNMIGVMEEQSLSQDLDSTQNMTSRTNPTSQVLPAPEGNDHHQSLQVSRILLQGAASFSSLSSALNSAMDSAERLVEDLEAYIHNYRTRRGHRNSPHNDERDSYSSMSTAVRPDSRTAETAGESSSLASLVESSSTRDVSVDAVLDERQTSNAMQANAASSSRRRTDSTPRVSDENSEVVHDSRRRRLR